MTIINHLAIDVAFTEKRAPSSTGRYLKEKGYYIGDMLSIKQAIDAEIRRDYLYSKGGPDILDSIIDDLFSLELGDHASQAVNALRQAGHVVELMSETLLKDAIDKELRARYRVDVLVSALEEAERGYRWLLQSGALPESLRVAISRRHDDLAKVLAAVEL